MMTVLATPSAPWARTASRRYVRWQRHSMRHEWPENTPAVGTFAAAEVRKQLARVPLQDMSRDVRENVESFIARVCDAQSTVPSVVPTDSAATLNWVAGKSTIEVEIGRSGATYLWASLGDGQQLSLADDAHAIISATRKLVTDMATRVSRRNPSWRIAYMER